MKELIFFYFICGAFAGENDSLIITDKAHYVDKINSVFYTEIFERICF